jgi:hypothetical protein
MAGWEALENGGAVWVRGPAADLECTRILPCLQRYFSRDEALHLEGTAVPTAQMPNGPWFPLNEVVIPSLPSFHLPAKAPGLAPVSLIRSDSEQIASALLVEWSILAAWAETAPAHRLGTLRFAAAAHGFALVLGTPPPPLPGRAFHAAGQLLLPSGFALAPHVWTAHLQQRLALDAGDWALLHPDAAVTLIPGSGIQAMSCSALRLTAPGMAVAQFSTDEGEDSA